MAGKDAEPVQGQESLKKEETNAAPASKFNFKAALLAPAPPVAVVAKPPTADATTAIAAAAPPAAAAAPVADTAASTLPSQELRAVSPPPKKTAAAATASIALGAAAAKAALAVAAAPVADAPVAPAPVSGKLSYRDMIAKAAPAVPVGGPQSPGRKGAAQLSPGRRAAPDAAAAAASTDALLGASGGSGGVGGHVLVPAAATGGGGGILGSPAAAAAAPDPFAWAVLQSSINAATAGSPTTPLSNSPGGGGLGSHGVDGLGVSVVVPAGLGTAPLGASLGLAAASPRDAPEVRAHRKLRLNVTAAEFVPSASSATLAGLGGI